MNIIYEVYGADDYGLMPHPDFTSESEQEARDYFRKVTNTLLNDDPYHNDRYVLRKKVYEITVLDDVSL